MKLPGRVLGKGMVHSFKRRNQFPKCRLLLTKKLIFIVVACLCVFFLTSSVFQRSFEKDTHYHQRKVDSKLASLKKKLKNEPLLNPYLFKYTINEETKCNGSTFLVIIVKSALQNEEQRQNIRNTYGEDIKKRDRIELIFVVGIDRKGTFQQHLQKESEMFGDIVQVTFIDSFRNLTFKTITAYNWVDQYCSNVQFVFLVDDDVYVNVNKTFSFLSSLPANKSLLGGKLMKNVKPIRCTYDGSKCKYGLTNDEYPFDTLPPYLLGRYILISIDVVRTLSLVFPYIKYLYIEDVFVGIAANKVGIVPEENPSFHFLGSLSNLKNPLCKMPNFIASHQLDLRIVHNRVHNCT